MKDRHRCLWKSATDAGTALWRKVAGFSEIRIPCPSCLMGEFLGMIRFHHDCFAKGDPGGKNAIHRRPALGLLIPHCKKWQVSLERRRRTVPFPGSAQLLELFHAQDYAKAKPRLYFKSLISDTWVRAEGMRVFPSTSALKRQPWAFAEGLPLCEEGRFKRG